MAQRYNVTSELREGVEVFSLAEAGSAVAEVAPSLGNNCFSFRTREPVLEAVSFDEFVKRPTSYGIPLLFPFPNRIRDGRFVFQGETYAPDPPRHGFVRDKPWTVVSHGASEAEGAWLTSRFDAGAHPEKVLRRFPFPFTLEATYRLKNGRLELEASARNTGDREMPVGFGIHPYFRKPAGGMVRVPADGRWELSDSLPTGRILPAEGAYDLREGKSLDGLSFDDIFTGIKADESGAARCLILDQENGTETVVEFPVERFPHVVVYTPPPPREAVCVEPNTCPTDAFNLRQQGIESNVIVLSAGETVEFRVSIYTRRADGSASSE
jgi:aldose 1-epimerase